MKQKFTLRDLTSLEPFPDGKQLVVWDTDIKGLGVRVSRAKDGNVTRVLFVQCRVKSEPPYLVKITLGPVAEEVRSGGALEALRKKASAMTSAAREGRDPRRTTKTMPTFAKFAETYMEERGGDYADGGKAARRAFDRAAAIFGNKPLDEVTRADIKRLHKSVAVEYPAAANKTVTMVSALFGHALDDDLIDKTPTHRFKLSPAEPRRVVLTVEEMMRFWGGLEVYEREGDTKTDVPAIDFADALRLLALTGARKTEVLAMTWAEIDLDSALWTRSAERNKNGLPSEIPLDRDAVAILRAIRARRDASHVRSVREATFVFPSSKSKQGRIISVEGAFHAALKNAAITKHVVIHDLRRTFASSLVRDGMLPSTARHLTGHASTAVFEGTYVQLQGHDALRAGLAQISAAYSGREKTPKPSA